jgi:putative tricarboxylic transport membrane protein
MKRDEVGAIFFICLGLFYVIISMKYDMGTFHNPQPGFLPRAMGVIMVFLSTLVLVKSLRRRKQETGLSEVWEGFGFKNILFAIAIIVCVVIYLLALNTLGFLFLSPFLVFVIAWMMGGKSWIINAVLGIVTSGLIYWTFWIIMRVPIPLGSFWQK